MRELGSKENDNDKLFSGAAREYFILFYPFRDHLSSVNITSLVYIIYYSIESAAGELRWGGGGLLNIN